MTSHLPPILAAAAKELRVTESLVDATVEVGILVMAIGSLACIYRIIRGPHVADRAVASDTLAVHLMGLVLLLTMRQGTLILLDGVLVLALLGFTGTVAVAQYIHRQSRGVLPHSPPADDKPGHAPNRS